MDHRGFFQRFSPWILVALVAALPFAFFGALRAVQSNTNQVEDWLPADFPETQDLKWFRQHFAADQFIIISWPECRLGPPGGDGNGGNGDDPRIEAFAQALMEEKNEKGESPYFKTVTTGRRVLDQLVSPPSNVPYAEAIRRLEGALVGPDGQQTCVIATLQPTATKKLRLVLGRPLKRAPLRMQRPVGVVFKALEKCDVPVDDVRLGGPPVDNVAIDEEGERTLIRLSGLSGLLGLGLAWWSLRSIGMTIIVFACGIISAAVAMAILWVTGKNMDAILLSMPSLVYVLGISGAVHIINYYRDGLKTHGPQEAVKIAVGHAWKPALLCSTTTAIGLGSLYWSELNPIKNFGLYSALGVMAMFVVLFAVLPAALQVFFVNRMQPATAGGTSLRIVNDNRSGASGNGSSRNNRKAKRKGNKPVQATKTQRIQRTDSEHHGAVAIAMPKPLKKAPRTTWEWFWSRWSYLLVNNYKTVTAISFLFIALMSYGLTRVKTSIDLLKLFDSEARILKDYAWFEEKLGPLVPLEIVLKFPTSIQQEHVASKEPVSDIPLLGPDQIHPESDATNKDPTKLSFIERLEIVDFCQRVLEQRHGAEGDGVLGHGMSAVTFVPQLPNSSGVLASSRRATASQKLWGQRKTLMQSGYLKQDHETEAELWRVSLRAAAFKDVDYQVLLRETATTVRPVLVAQQLRHQLIAQLTQQKHSSAVSGSVIEANWIEPPKDQMGEYERKMMNTALKYFLGTEGVRLIQVGEADRKRIKGSSLAKADLDIRNTDAATAKLIYQNNNPPPLDTKALAADTSDTKVDAVFTGVVPIVYKAQRELLQGLIQSTMWSFLTITPLMMFVCRNFFAGIVVMIPNTLPVLAVFGGMGWLKIPVDIGSMMAASIALGVAVDDTIHFLSWYKDDLARLQHRKLATLAAYRKCCNPTLQSALISGLGLSVFAFSTFTPTQRFGWLMLTILIAGVVAELFMLPAILVGPLGKVFKVPPRKSAEPEPEESPVKTPKAPSVVA